MADGWSHEGLIRRAVLSYPEEMADVVATLAWSVSDDDDLVEYLQRCVDLAVRVVTGAHYAGVTACTGGDPFTAVHTDAVTLEVDSHQYECGDGPCLHSMSTGQIVRVDVATSRERWPEFTDAAETAGVRSFLAAPLGSGHDRLGALNLYSRDQDGFGSDDEVLLRVLLVHATRALRDYAALQDARRVLGQLREAMASRAPIEQAKGILMAARGVSADAAFDLLRAESQNTNTKLHDVATAFVTRHSTPTGAR